MNAQEMTPTYAEVAASLEALLAAFGPRSGASLDARPTVRTTLVGANDTPSTWPAIRRYVLRRDDYACTVCGERATEVDHIFPRRHGGSDFLENLRAICGTCNRRKGTAADFQAALFQDLSGGLDVAIRRILVEVNDNMVPLLAELTERVVYEDATGDTVDITLDVIEALGGVWNQLTLDIANRITVARMKVQR